MVGAGLCESAAGISVETHDGSDKNSSIQLRAEVPDSAQHSERMLTPKSFLRRRAAGTDSTAQLIANNVGTLFV